MDFKTFNIHHFSNGAVAHKLKFRGFTAIVSPGKKERSVDVRMALCSKKDIYCRKTGVQAASDEKSEGYTFTCNARELLNELDDRSFSMKCNRVDHSGLAVTDKEFLYKYLF